MAELVPNDVIIACTTLKDSWDKRKKKFDNWFDLLLLVDELEQEGMESVVSNNPRTGFNIAKHLLTSMIIADKIPSDGLATEFIPAASYFEKFMQNRWRDQEKRYRSMGRQSWMGELVGWMLALGWYNVFAMADENRCWAEVWSPYDCFPAFGADGLIEHAHIYTMNAGAARRKIKQMGWNINITRWDTEVTFYDWWFFDNDGDACNAIVVNNQWAKRAAKDLKVSKTGRLPVFCSAVGGLPDMGSIKTNNLWQEHYGESLLAVNEDVFLQYNKMRSFVQQAARTAAQPHWLELSTGETVIATEALMEQWGSVLHGSPGDSVNPIQSNPIPIELTSAMYLYQNEMSKGLFSDIIHGILEKNMSYLSMANVAASAMQVLIPFRDALIGLRTDINNFWTDMILKNNFTPNKFVKPAVMPDRDDLVFDVDADIDIPGQVVQKATVARMMNPNFRLPVQYVTEKLFPEILNPLESMANVRAEDARMHPKSKLADNIIAYEEYARQLRITGDTRHAELYEKLAKSMEAELDAPQTQMPGEPSAESMSIPRELQEGV